MDKGEPIPGSAPNEALKLDYSKVEGDARRLNYENGVRGVIETYSIPDNAFRHGKEETIGGAIRLLGGYDVDPLFLEEPERNLFALAISDAWLSTESITEKKGLLDILKLVSTGIMEDKRFGTLSGKVRVLSKHGSVRGTMFDPEFTTRNINSQDKVQGKRQAGNQHSEYMSLIQRYIEENKDDEQTQRVKDVLTDWGEGSEMSKVRERLKVFQGRERPFNVLVLNKNAQQMFDDLGYTSLHISNNTGVTIVFNSDWKLANSLEHEYAHSQSDGLNRWYQGLLFRGMNEALTENATSNPKAYHAQREVLQQILTIHPEYETMMYDAYIGGSEARRDLFSKIIDEYGFEGFMVFARVAPIDNPKMSGEIGQAVFIEPQKAIEFFVKNVQRS